MQFEVEEVDVAVEVDRIRKAAEKPHVQVRRRGEEVTYEERKEVDGNMERANNNMLDEPLMFRSDEQGQTKRE